MAVSTPPSSNRVPGSVRNPRWARSAPDAERTYTSDPLHDFHLALTAFNRERLRPGAPTADWE